MGEHTKRRKVHEMVGYTNDTNPFGDSDLGRKFTWRKGRPPEADDVVVAEIQTARRRRTAHTLEQRREPPAEDLEEKEAEFEAQQVKLRSQVRLAAGRGKAIDSLAANVLAGEDSRVRLEPRRPAQILDELGVAELEEVAAEARKYARLSFKEYWRAVEVAAEHRLPRDMSKVKHVEQDVVAMFRGKTKAELDTMAAQIRERDDPYWDYVREECDHARALAVMDATYDSLVEGRVLPVIEETIVPKRETASDYDTSPAAAAMEEAYKERCCDDDEDLFKTEVAAAPPKWSTSTTLKKPRYVNRVRTGYDWNKYNQTHYTAEEPPPKTVQGYKFHIFYPELRDATKAPTYFKGPCDEDDYCIITFVSPGPPYANLAFKIVNQDWERGQKRGFKCSFERGVLELHFTFKRWRYKR